MSVLPIHWLLIIGTGTILILLAYGDKKKKIRINNSGLEFAMWIVISILFFKWLLFPALTIM